jgi:PAS domain S-box-containing protein
MVQWPHAWLCQQIIDQTPDAVIVADRAGIIRLWNAGAATLFGYPAAEAVGQSLDLLIPPPLRARHWEGYRRVMATGHTSATRPLLAVPGLRKDGTRLSLEFTVVLLAETPGQVVGIAAVLRDVTARWQRERALQSALAAAEETAQENARQSADLVRQACLAAALQAYEDAGLSGLCAEGRWEAALDALRSVPLRPLVDALLQARADTTGARLGAVVPSPGTTAGSGGDVHETPPNAGGTTPSGGA